MPIKIPNDLPAKQVLARENIFVMTENRAVSQNIRPLQILIFNLMPTKITTETQLARMLSNSPLQLEIELMQTRSYTGHNTSQDHMLRFYSVFDEVRDKYYDGMIITGAPVEKLPFEQVEYWEELCEVMEWSKTHVHSTFHICWGAQAGLYYHYGIPKLPLEKKLSGVFRHRVERRSHMLMRGFDDEFMVPHSRNTTVRREDVEACSKLKILAASDKAGIYALATEGGRQIFIMGHSEYDPDTLKNEYERDLAAGLNPEVPDNYFPNDDPARAPVVRWRSHGSLLYQNWLNYFVYQVTPYDIRTIAPVTPEDAITDDLAEAAAENRMSL